MVWLIVIASFLVIVTLLNWRTARPDGEFLGKTPPYRKVMLHIMPTRNESVVYYDDYAVSDELERFLKDVEKRFHADMTHALVAAVSAAIRKNPSMNRFAAGRRLYQRNGVWVTFSMKRQKLNRAAKLTAVKREIPESQTFKELCDSLNENIKVERSDAVTYVDKEVGLLASIPRPIMRIGYNFLRRLDYYGLLPASFIKNDGMFTSIFLANLGSIGMKAGLHHLYEWGTCPLFAMVGRIEERAFVENGQVVVKRVMPLRFTFDERVDDGLNAGHGIKAAIDVLEHPYEYLGCVAADGSDDHPIGRPPEAKLKVVEAKIVANKTVAVAR